MLVSDHLLVVLPVVDFFDIDRAVVAIAMNFLDRYLATVPKGAWINKNYFQKIAMTSFYLAIKLNHTTVLCMAGANTTIESISLLSENRVAATEIEEMEVEMLRELQWYAHPPSPYVFLSLLMEGMGITDRTVCQRARFFIEESTMEYSYVLFPPSSIAAAALWNAMEMLPASTAKVDEMSLPKDTFDIHSPSIRACRLHLSRILEEEAPADEKSCIIIANDPPCQSPIAAKANKGQLLPSPASIRDPLIV